MVTKGGVPEMAKIFNDFAFAEKDSIDSWMQAIMQLKMRNIDRFKSANKVIAAGYSAVSLAKTMRKIYEQ